MSAPAGESGVAGPRRRGRRPVTVASMAAVLAALLSIQFLLGTYLELYVTIPSGRDLGALPLDGLVVLILHIVVGILVVGTSIRLTVVAVRTHSGRDIALSAIALIGMIVAFLAGLSFTFGDQTDAASFVMAFGFFLGMLCAALLFGGAQLPRPAADSGAP